MSIRFCFHRRASDASLVRRKDSSMRKKAAIDLATCRSNIDFLFVGKDSQNMKYRGVIFLGIVSASLFGCTASPVSSAINSSPSSASAFDDPVPGARFFALGETYSDEAGDSAAFDSAALSESELVLRASIKCASASELFVPFFSFILVYCSASNFIQNRLSSGGLGYSVDWESGYYVNAAATNEINGSDVVTAEGFFVSKPLSGEVSFVFETDPDFPTAVSDERLSGTSVFISCPLPAPRTNLRYCWELSFADIALR